MENSKNGKRREIYQSHGLFGLQNLKTPLIFQTPKLRKVAHDRRLRLAWHVSCGWRHATVGTLHPRRRGVNLGKRQETGQISSNMVEPQALLQFGSYQTGNQHHILISPTSKGTFWVDDSSLSRWDMVFPWRVYVPVIIHASLFKEDKAIWFSCMNRYEKIIQGERHEINKIWQLKSFSNWPKKTSKHQTAWQKHSYKRTFQVYKMSAFW